MNTCINNLAEEIKELMDLDQFASYLEIWSNILRFNEMINKFSEQTDDW